MAAEETEGAWITVREAADRGAAQPIADWLANDGIPVRLVGDQLGRFRGAAARCQITVPAGQVEAAEQALLALDTASPPASLPPEPERGLDQFGGRATWALRALFYLSLVLLFVAFVTTRHVADGEALFLAGESLIAPPLLLAFLLVREFLVGDDGFSFQRGPFRKRYLRLHDITAVEVSESRSLNLPSVTTVSLRSAETCTFHGAPAGFVESLRARLARVRGASPGIAAGRLSKGDRSNEAWRASVAEMGSRSPDTYRDAPLRDEDVWSVLEDPSADPSARAAAAAVLRGRMSDEGRARVRVAAETTVDPKVRVALEAAGAGDEAAVSKALSAWKG